MRPEDHVHIVWQGRLGGLRTAISEVLQGINRCPADLARVFEAMLEKALVLCGAVIDRLTPYDGDLFTTVASRRGAVPVGLSIRREPGTRLSARSKAKTSFTPRTYSRIPAISTTPAVPIDALKVSLGHCRPAVRSGSPARTRRERTFGATFTFAGVRSRKRWCPEPHIAGGPSDVASFAMTVIRAGRFAPLRMGERGTNDAALRMLPLWQGCS